MNSSEIIEFLRLIGAENITNDEARGWVRASCPLARWKHESGQDRKPSFGIKIPEKDGEAPYFHCFTCETNGPLPKLLSILSQCSGDRLLEASNFLSQLQLFDNKENEVNSGGRRRIRIKDKFASLDFGAREIKVNRPVPASVLEQYPLLAEKNEYTAHAEALRWICRERKISLATVEKYKLRLFTNSLDDVGVIFPILDKDGETVLDMWARLIHEKSFFRVTNSMSGTSVDYKAPNLLFGNHAFDPKKPGVLVEGAIDALRLHSLGVKNVLASFGSLSNEQIESLYAPVMYVGFDNDDAGRDFTKKAVKKLDVPSICILDWEVANVKDAGELETIEQFKKDFDARKKILKSSKVKNRVVTNEERPKRVFLKDDGSFL